MVYNLFVRSFPIGSAIPIEEHEGFTIISFAVILFNLAFSLIVLPRNYAPWHMKFDK